MFRALLVICVLIGVGLAQRLPIFDAHLHYNFEPNPYYTLEQVQQLLRINGVMGVLANSRPNDGTRVLYEAKSKDLWVVPFARPYQVRDDIQTWFTAIKSFELIQNELKRGYYKGIGEFHIYGKDAASPVVRRFVHIAVENNLYMLAHADEPALEQLFAHDPKVKVIWAHTGFTTPTTQLDAYLKRYSNLWLELSYRSGITDGQRKLTPEWKQLFERHPTRFLLGSDTWVDSRWQSYPQIIEEYRGWLAQLPSDVAAKIAYQNAERMFKP